jgi:hypothetical protein
LAKKNEKNIKNTLTPDPFTPLAEGELVCLQKGLQIKKLLYGLLSPWFIKRG